MESRGQPSLRLTLKLEKNKRKTVDHKYVRQKGNEKNTKRF